MLKILRYGATALFSLLCFIVLASSCVNDEFDMSGDNLNLEITSFQDGIALPLGSTGEITVEKLLQDSENEFLKAGPDGSYSVSYSDVFNVAEELPDFKSFVKFPDMSIYETVDFRLGNIGARAVDGLTATVSENYEFDILSPGDLPEEVVALDLVELTGQSMYIRFSASDLSLPEGVSLLVDLEVEFPDMMKVDKADENGVVRFSGEISKTSSTLHRYASLESIDFTGIDVSKKVSSSLKINSTLKLSVSSPVDLSQWANKDLSLGLSISIRDMKVKKMTGNVEYSAEPIVKTIDLGELNSFFDGKGDDVNLAFNRVLMGLDITTNMGISLNADVDLVPYYGGNAANAKALTADIVLKPSASADKKEVTNYVFDEKSVLEIVKKLPEKLDFIVEAKTDPKRKSVIEPGESYYLYAGYDFELPMEFGKDFKFAYKTTVEDIPEIVGELLSKGNKIKLGGEVKNSLPLGFTLQFNFLDSKGEIVESVKDSAKPIAPCGKEGQASKSELDIVIALENIAGAKEITSLELVFNAASAGVTGVPLKKDSYIQADLQLVFPEGITIDLDEILNDDDK